MQMIMWLALRVDAPAPDAEQTWLFEGEVPFVPREGADVLVLNDIPEGVRVKRVRHLRSRQEYEVVLGELYLDEAGIPHEQSYELLEAAGWSRVDRLERSDDVGASKHTVIAAGSGDLTAQQAARELGVTDRRISQLCSSGAVPGYKDGNDHWRIPREALLAYQNGLEGLPPDGRRRHVVLTSDGPVAGRQMSVRELHNLNTAENSAAISQLLVQQQVAFSGVADCIERLTSLVAGLGVARQAPLSW